jgi:serine protease Do
MRARALLLALAAWLAAGPAGASDPFLRETVTVRAVKESGPAVVNITSERDVSGPSPFAPLTGDPFFDRFFRDFFEPRLPRTAQSLGSGVVIDGEHHILTNDHVVSRASRIRVALADGREFDAQLVGADPTNDIAVLLVETKDKIPWVPMGTSGDLMVGEPVIAIGNPFGLSNTVTTGVISALNRSLRTENRVFHGFIQTDASINPGNSGGPLLNAEGKLVGINTAVYQGGQGIGFAIPIDTAARIVRELIASGEIHPVWVGLEFQDLTPELASALHLPPGLQGALVNRVHDRSPAGAAGLRRGDIVTKLDDRPLSSARDFFDMLDSAVTGQKLALEVRREGQTLKMSVEAEQVPDAVVTELIEDMLGVSLKPHPGGGYVVQEVRRGSGSDRIGIQAGDVLLGINGRALADDDSLRRSALDLRGRAQALLVVQRGAGRYHVTVPLV